jgi:hypothetical protein
MKNTSDYSLNNLENYKENFAYTINQIMEKYILLINEFLKFILEKNNVTPWRNSNKLSSDYSAKFIIIRGYETITNTFNFILYYTKNLNLTFYHCQKAYYYYIEFIEQISNVDHSFLQLNSRDAATYVYKKTLSELNNNLEKEPSCSMDRKHLMETFDEYTKIFKNIFEFLLQFLDLNDFSNNEKNVEKFKITCEKIFFHNSTSNKENHIKKVFTMYNNIDSINKAFLEFHKIDATNMTTFTESMINEYFQFLIQKLK